MKNGTLRLKRDLLYMQSLRALKAAFYFDAAVFLSKQTKPTSYRDAEAASDFTNLMWGKKTTPKEFLKPLHQNIEDTLTHYDQYKLVVKDWPLEKQTLESFVKHYVWTGREFAMLKCNLFYILFLGMIIEESNFNKIDQTTKERLIDSIITSGSVLFTFNKQWVLRSFIQAAHTFAMIDEKILIRKAKKLNECKY